jgi:TPR repeat protein
MLKKIFIIFCICCNLSSLTFAVAAEEGCENLSEKKQIECYEKKALAGDIKSQFNLAGLYAYGQNKDLAKVVKYYSMAAEQGDKTAMNNLAIMYEKGEGVKQDYSKAFELWFSAIMLGDSAAEYNLCSLYHNLLDRNFYCNEEQFKHDKKYEKEEKNKRNHPPLCLGSYVADFEGFEVRATPIQEIKYHFNSSREESAIDSRNEYIQKTHFQIKTYIMKKNREAQNGDQYAIDYINNLRIAIKKINYE